MARTRNEGISPDLTVAEIARIMPQTVAVFEEAGIDYCCRGARSLADAAAGAGFTADELMDRIAAAPCDGLPNWDVKSLTELTHYLAADHEETIRTTLAQLRDAIDRAATADNAPAVNRIKVLFGDYAKGVIAHMLNEERDLFPCIEFLESTIDIAHAGPKPRVSQRVLREMVEHETFREKLRTMRELSWQLEPNDAVTDLRKRLRACSREVHQHIHLENNVLYPRAIALENAAKQAV